ncbi:unnamed protein product [Pleuronectes platessa]|uniref:Uncharacterized protein n=1 Tax=Pleuronectes platessa TaxID=8262 RepID=A0A9N7V5X9_PLEPL|nr:unnamed protein product [Pleuronectes platessa]
MKQAGHNGGGGRREEPMQHMDTLGFTRKGPKVRGGDGHIPGLITWLKPLGHTQHQPLTNNHQGMKRATARLPSVPRGRPGSVQRISWRKGEGNNYSSPHQHKQLWSASARYIVLRRETHNAGKP